MDAVEAEPANLLAQAAVRDQVPVSGQPGEQLGIDLARGNLFGAAACWFFRLQPGDL
ncbi:MAG: hypothetical protein FWF25_06695 [Propionibacteriaceae bacterium]|nr:hypothetical protein [Propionibacteriaceae bacterium]